MEVHSIVCEPNSSDYISVTTNGVAVYITVRLLRLLPVSVMCVLYPGPVRPDYAGAGLANKGSDGYFSCKIADSCRVMYSFRHVRRVLW